MLSLTMLHCSGLVLPSCILLAILLVHRHVRCQGMACLLKLIADKSQQKKVRDAF